jgi:hypothetical protein
VFRFCVRCGTYRNRKLFLEALDRLHVWSSSFIRGHRASIECRSSCPISDG